MKFQIKHRITSEVKFECDLSAEMETASYSLQLGFAVKAAVKARANLTDANLVGANLTDANFTGADLTGANLAVATLAHANFTDADLTGANFAAADLTGADLAGARNAPDLPPTEETDEQREARYAERAARFRERFPEVPVVEALDAKILDAINVEGCKLDMSAWHKCETTHCRAGWALTLAGKEGEALETKYGPADAGRRIYLASTGYVPNFYATDLEALADIKARAATQLRAE
jgi:hypothetical protein